FSRDWSSDVCSSDLARLVEQAVLGGQHNDRRLLEQLVVLDQRAGLVAIQARHHDVDEDDLRPLVGDLGQRLESVGGGHDVGPLPAQQGLCGAADGLRIVDHHHAQALEAASATLVLRHRVSPVHAAYTARPIANAYLAASRNRVKHALRFSGQVPGSAAGGPARGWYHLSATAPDGPYAA